MSYRIRRIIHPLVIKLPALKIKLRLIRENVYKTEENGPVIFACNHACFYDTTAALQSIGRHAYILGGKQRLYVADRFFVWLNGAIWVNRTDHLLMLPMRWGIIEAAMQTGAEIVPMALEL